MQEIKFDPVGWETQARIDNPSYAEAHQRQGEESQRYLAPIIEYFERLEKEVADMPIAQRFRRDKKPDLTLTSGGEGQFLPNILELSEAEFKRSQLMADLLNAKGKAMGVIGQIESIVMDIEATKRD